ncbi:MAG: UDP-N-acetylglucosamine 2-epimerase (non-hydrolyzing) [Candidatus Aminicenantes bacterium]|nr:UDP-N-acetylglucosamine 2-epimerase (non-hydrolyzing) [Candidatus Aminicenantes bacterium]
MAAQTNVQTIKVLVVMGTRPEVIKLAPVIEALKNEKETGSKSAGQSRRVRFKTVICLTGQHREMVEPFLKIFGIKPDHDLRVMQPDQHLGELTGRVLAGMKKVLEVEKPDWLLVQGDTTSAMAAALAAFYQQIKIGHVEAGLRTDDKYNPFPEEINRRLISHLADLHFAPTELARKNLLREGIAPERIFVTGNTVVDALKMILKKTGRAGGMRVSVPGEILRIKEAMRESSTGAVSTEKLPFSQIKKIKKLILVTAHRRESFGPGMENICRAILRVVKSEKSAEVIFPVHLNPAVRRAVFRHLLGQPRIHLVEPLDYVTFVHLMRRASLILTDSGGIQEEAPSLGVPVVVMRETTERTEAIQAGVAWLAGTDPDTITRLALRLLKKVESGEFRRGLRRRNPFGDGRAGQRIALLLKRGGSGRPRR